MTSERGGGAGPPPISATPEEDPPADGGAAQGAADRAVVEAAETRMLEMLPRRMNVGAFAAENGLTVSQLEQVFEDVRGASSYRSFLIRRLDRVEGLAAEKQIPLKTASAHCGFGHFGVFRRAFLTQFGRMPKDGFGAPQKPKRRGVRSGAGAA